MSQSVPVKSEVHDLRPPAVAPYHHCLRVQKDPPDTQISANYRALPNVLLTNFRPSVKKTKQIMEQKKRKFRSLLGAQ